MEYVSGDYFGELALLNDKPRAASIYAKVTFWKDPLCGGLTGQELL